MDSNSQKDDDVTMSKGHILRAIMRRYGTCRYAILGVLEQLEVAGLFEIIEGKTLKTFRQFHSMVNKEGEGGRGGVRIAEVVGSSGP